MWGVCKWQLKRHRGINGWAEHKAVAGWRLSICRGQKLNTTVCLHLAYTGCCCLSTDKAFHAHIPTDLSFPGSEDRTAEQEAHWLCPPPFSGTLWCFHPGLHQRSPAGRTSPSCHSWSEAMIRRLVKVVVRYKKNYKIFTGCMWCIMLLHLFYLPLLNLIVCNVISYLLYLTYTIL